MPVSYDSSQTAGNGAFGMAMCHIHDAIRDRWIKAEGNQYGSF